MVRVCLLLLKKKKKKTAKLASKVAVLLWIPTGNEWEFLLLHIFLAFGIVSVLEVSHSDRYIVISPLF